MDACDEEFVLTLSVHLRLPFGWQGNYNKAVQTSETEML